MTENYQPIPHRLKNMAIGGHVAGAEDIDAGNGKTQQDINADTYRKDETYSKEQLNNMITTPEQKYENYTAEDGDTFSDLGLPAEGKAGTTYRVGSWDGTEYNASKFSEYSWDGTQYILLSVQSPGIDAAIKANSNNLLESGAAANLLDAASALATTPTPTVVDGKYMSDEGEVTNADMQYWTYSVSPNDSFLFSGKFSTNTNPYFVLWLNGSTVLGHESYMGSTETAVEYIDQMITAPANATHLCLNVESSQASLSKVKKLGDLLLSRELKDGILENKKYIDPVRGGMFIFDRAGVTPNGSIHEDWADGLACTDFLCIINEDNIICENLWDNDYVVGVAFYNENKQFISRAVGTANPTGQTDFNISTEDIPEGAKYIRCTENYLRTGPHIIVSGVSLSSLNEKVLSLDSNLSAVQEAITEYNLTGLVATVIPGGFYLVNGTFKEFSGYQVNKYNVEGGGKYAFSGITVTGADLYYVTWWNEQDEFISAEPYKGSATEPTAYVNQIIQAPLYAHYLCLNVLTSRQDEFNASHATPSYVSSSELKDDIESIKNSNTGSMKITVRGNTAYVRTSLDSTNDIIIKFSQYLNGNMSPVETYMGLNTATDDTIMQNTIHSWSDSTAPLRAVPQYWHLYAQHGIPIPLVTITDNPLTDDDIDSWWKDQSDREYQIGKINGNQVYLVPKVTQTDTPGIVTRSWRDSIHDSMPTLLTHVSGATHTSPLTIATSSQFQLRPIQTPIDRKFVCDGIEVSDGVYQCDTFVISETLKCLDVTHVTQYFPQIVSTQDAAYITNSFIFKGTSIGFNQIFDCKNPVQFSYYGANQAQHLKDINDLECYVKVPRVKRNNANGVPMSKLFRSRTTDDDVVVFRTSYDLYNVDKAPDRQISILKPSEGSPVIGFASGISLIKGVTRDEVRNTYIANFEGTKGNALFFSPANNNKFYIGVITGANTDHFTNYLMQPDFCKEFSTYFTYFKPTDDIQSYWYNDGDTTVIYAHAESNIGRTYIDVSDFTSEGKMLEVVEKTDNANLITDSIVNGKVCVSFTSNDANYIVLRTV